MAFTEMRATARIDEEIIRRVHLAGAASALGLLERVPEHFKRRGWRQDEDRIATALAAVCCVFLGAGNQRFRLPVGARDDAGWASLAAPVVEAWRIVEALDMRELLEPVP